MFMIIPIFYVQGKYNKKFFVDIVNELNNKGMKIIK